MFQTFKLPPDCSSRPLKSKSSLLAPSTRSSHASRLDKPSSSSSSSSSPGAKASRGKDEPHRQTAARACDRCRLYRVRCGAWPCEQCQLAKAKCIMSADNPARKRAPSEKRKTAASASNNASPQLDLHAPRPSPCPATAAATPDDSGLDEYYQLDRPTLFFSKISAFFTDAHSRSLHQAHADTTDPSGFLNIPCPPVASLQDASTSTPALTHADSGSFIHLFWEAYHPMMPFLDPDEIEALHGEGDPALPPSPTHAAPSPLLDILTALGMQHAAYGGGNAPRLVGSSFDMPHASDESIHWSWPGYAYFRRCADFINFEASPTVSTVACQTLMAAYLMRGSHLQSAYRTLGAAVRDALHLGLHREPPASLAPPDKQRLRHLWWALYARDVQCSCQLNRLSTISTSAVSVSLPCEQPASLYCVYSAQLATAVSKIRGENPNSESLGLSNRVQDVSALEDGAEKLTEAIDPLGNWLGTLPAAWRGDMRPDRDMLSAQISPSRRSLGLAVPDALQRQRTLLQVHYHDAHILLRRSFICFPRALNLTRLQQPHTDQHARMALVHSIALTNLLHRHLSTSDSLHGCPEALQPLWNAAVTMLAFVVANPGCTRAPGARESISKALDIFSASAATNPLSSYASKTLAVLSARLQELMSAVEAGSKSNFTPGSSEASAPSAISSNTTLISAYSPGGSARFFDAPDAQSSFADVPMTSQGLSDDFDKLFDEDENLRSWMESIQSSTWQTYQSDVNHFLAQPDDVITGDEMIT